MKEDYSDLSASGGGGFWWLAFGRCGGASPIASVCSTLFDLHKEMKCVYVRDKAGERAYTIL